MKKRIFTFILNLLCATLGITQTCPDFIDLFTQADVDAFSVNFPNCTDLPGTLSIVGEDITNLNGLSQITSVGGDLSIFFTKVTNLAPLSNLTTIGDFLSIISNEELVDLSGLENLTSFGNGELSGNIGIQDNMALKNLSGLSGLTTIYTLTIADNKALLNLEGLNNLDTIRWQLDIIRNDSLVSLSGLNKLASLGDGVPNFDDSYGLTIEYNDRLTDLSSLLTLTSIDDGRLTITNNKSLTSLHGLDNIDPTSIDSLILESSSMLSTCNVASICTYLENGGGATITGNATRCNNRIEIIDHCIVPTAICQNDTINLDANGMASITPAQINNGSSDDRGIAALALSKMDYTCTDFGNNAVSLTVTDTAGNTAICMATVTVQDIINPVARCKNITVELDANGMATITPAQVNNESSDNCDITLSLSKTSFICSNLGSNTVTLTATDIANNTATCTATVTVQDNSNPIATCKNITIELDANEMATIIPAQVNNASSDNCDVTLSLSKTSFDCSNVGTNMVTLTATDMTTNTATCMATVTVQDNVNPVAICKNITIELDANGMASITPTQVNNGSSDNCDVTLSLNKTSFDCSNLGSNTVTLTATDIANNTATCMATIMVQDIIDPVATCKNVTVELNADGIASITLAQANNGSSDNCDVTLSLSKTSFDCSNVGSNTVTLTATDMATNTATCTATVTVQDNSNPIVTCKNITIELDVNEMASITPAQVNNESSDNCDFTLSLSKTSFDCSNVGTNMVTLTATDMATNTATCMATVTVQDNVNPVATCKNIIIELDANGMASITPVQINNGSSDNCEVTLSLSKTSFDCSNLEENTITLTATDIANNTATCTATVMVQDIIDPVATCKNVTVELDADGLASITPVQANNGSSDNCEVTLSLSKTSFDCSNLGSNMVTLTATDMANNTAICTTTVTVQDNINPVATENCTDESCPETLIIDANSDLSLPEHRASTTITTEGDVTIASTTSFKAGTSITLKPGFQVNNGTNFSAIIEDCADTFTEMTNEEMARIAPTSPLSIIKESSLTIYPNPVTSHTTIKYHLPTTGKVDLQVLDFMGRQVAVLEDNTIKEVGTYQYNFQADNLVAGTYFVVLRSEGLYEFKKIVALK